jgi:1-acyl-sn-glycerol-3-phosphate acyltransferase
VNRSHVRAGLRAAAFLILTAVLLGPYLLSYSFGRKPRRAVTALYFRGCCALAGLAVCGRGPAAPAGPVLYVANHVSYLDVLALGALLDATFVAKREIASWPLFGWLARIGRTIFIQRSRRYAGDQCNLLSTRLSSGDDLILFPEGTSSDGSRVLPFKSTLFACAGNDGGAAWVQPISIAYTRFADGQPLAPETSPLYAWFDDTDFAPHLWTVFGLKGTEVEIVFHPPVDSRAYSSRKALARHCEAEVARGLARSLAAVRIPRDAPSREWAAEEATATG